MDKIKFDFFDILGYLIPGTALLLSLWITADASILKFDDLYGFISKITANTLLAGVVVAYVMGFTLHFFGSIIFIWRHGGKKKKRDAVTSDLSLYWSLIREYGGKHLPMLDRWQALKALSNNLAAFSVIAFVLSIVKFVWTGFYWEWLILPFVFVSLFFAYSNRAQKFSAYLDDDSYAVFELLKLKEKLPSK